MATWYTSREDVKKINQRVQERKQAIREAELRHPGKRLGYRDGIMIFVATGLPVPGSPIIKKPNKAQTEETNRWL